MGALQLGTSLDGRLGVGLFYKVGVDDPMERTIIPLSYLPSAAPEQMSNSAAQADMNDPSQTLIVQRKARAAVEAAAPKSVGLQVWCVSCVLHTVVAAGPNRFVFSFGSGVGFRLGHGDCETTPHPRRIEALASRGIGAESISCANKFSGIVAVTISNSSAHDEDSVKNSKREDENGCP